jgi:suppressor of cytokine signaling 5
MNYYEFLISLLSSCRLFRRYNRSLHARIEESRHQFSFDCHDPGVHRARSVCGLLEHYKDPLSCMFFEPMLLYPVPRRKTFSLQELARAAICDRCTYGRVSQLPLPQTLKAFLREYSYKHKFRTRQLDCSVSRQNAQLATEAAAAAGRR